MSYANVFELTKCLDDCLAYCQEHPDREHARFHQPLLEEAKRELDDTTEKAGREFTEWRMENRDDQLAWKHLAGELRSIQDQLESVNAIGFIDQRIRYWNRERLLAAVDAMLTYLREHEEDLDFAADCADKLERRRRKAISEGDEADRALDDYVRFSKMRADGLSNAKDTIANFRKVLRRDLSTRDEDYQSIQWPQQVASDNKVL